MLRLLVAFSLFVITGCASVDENNSLVTGDASPPPYGAVRFMADDTRYDLPVWVEGRIDNLNGKSFKNVRSELQAIKRILDHNFVYKEDQELYGVREDWRSPAKMTFIRNRMYGDCDDYAILATAMLKNRGFRPRLLIAKIKGKDDYHLVTEVNGWLVDNRLRFVVRHDAVGYRYHSIEDPQRGWLKIVEQKTSAPKDRRKHHSGFF